MKTDAPFFSISLEDAIGSSLPHDEALKKRGRFGSFVVNNRALLVKFICFFVVLAAGAVAVFVLSMAMRMGAAAANGINGVLPLTAPWTDAEMIENLLVKQNSVTKMVNGLNVSNIIEPRRRVEVAAHLPPLVAGMRARAARLVNTDAGLKAQLRAGFLQWNPFATRTGANFTLAFATTLLTKELMLANEPCTCFVEFGLPYNSVVTSAEVLHNITLERASEEQLNLGGVCGFSDIFDDFMLELQQQPGEKQSGAVINTSALREPVVRKRVVSKSGIVCHYDAKTNFDRRCAIYGRPIYQCIEHCNHLFVRVQQLARSEVGTTTDARAVIKE